MLLLIYTGHLRILSALLYWYMFYPVIYSHSLVNEMAIFPHFHLSMSHEDITLNLMFTVFSSSMNASSSDSLKFTDCIFVLKILKDFLFSLANLLNWSKS